jgi:hypothetical protein
MNCIEREWQDLTEMNCLGIFVNEKVDAVCETRSDTAKFILKNSENSCSILNYGKHSEL